MHFSITLEHDPSEPKTGTATVGWLLTDECSGILFHPPERLNTHAPNKAHGKSASRCPAVLQMESRYFIVKCPYDIHIGFERDEKGNSLLINRSGESSSIRTNKLKNILTLVNEAEWRFPDRPTIQLNLPYLFVADEPIYITQLSPFAHYREQPLPGTIFGGRFPIHVWPRPLMWAFEWHDTSKDIQLKRGEPLFYCQFETEQPSRSVQLIQAQMTDDLKKYLNQLSAVANYVNQTFSLFKEAEAVRPSVLVSPANIN